MLIPKDSAGPVELVIAYAREDQLLCDLLQRHLEVLRQEGLAFVWTEQSVSVGDDADEVVSAHIRNAGLIILLLSADFFGSRYWRSRDMEEALLHHERKDGTVILPVLLRPCDLPRELRTRELISCGGAALSQSSDIDLGLKSVAERVREMIDQMRPRAPPPGKLPDGDCHDSGEPPPVTDHKLIVREHVQRLLELLARRERLEHEHDLAGVAATTRLVEDLAHRTRQLIDFKRGDIVAGACLLGPIGTGSFATVWSAEQAGKLVAVKTFDLHKLTEGAMLWRFRRGIRATQHLTNRENPDPAIVPILQVDDSELAFSMPRATPLGSSGNLEDIASRRWSIDKKVRVLLKLSRALKLAHRAGVLHRDIKPANVVVYDKDCPGLTDFDTADACDGAAIDTFGLVGLGTLAFAAPEQLGSGSAADARSDVYSLGRLLHYLLCEKPLAFRSKEHLDLRELSAFPRTLVAIVRRATQHDPADRFQTVKELRAALERWASRESRALAVVDVAVRSARRHWVPIVFAVALALVAVAAVIHWPFVPQPTNHEEPSPKRADRDSIPQLEKKLDHLWEGYQQSTRRNEEQSMIEEANRIQRLVDDIRRSEDDEIPDSARATTRFRHAEAMVKMQGVLEIIGRSCVPVQGYEQDVVVDLEFFNNGTTTAKVRGTPALPSTIIRCIEDELGRISISPFTHPPAGAHANKRFRIKR